MNARNKINSQRIALPIVFGLFVIALAFVVFSNDRSTQTDKVAFLCSKNNGTQTSFYYVLNTVGAVDEVIPFTNRISDLTVKMSRISSREWDTASLCDSEKVDLPESEWRTLSVGSDCGVGASIAACDADIASDGTSVHLFPLVNGYYSGTAKDIERGALIKITGKISE